MISLVCSLLLAAATPANPDDAVTFDQILPIRFYCEPVGERDPIDFYLEFTAAHVSLNRWVDGKVVVRGSVPYSKDDLLVAIKQIAPADLSGNVSYSHPSLRDGTVFRLVTPYGQISEYGVFNTNSDIRWPQSILRLEPLFEFCHGFSRQLLKKEVKTEQDAAANP